MKRITIISCTNRPNSYTEKVSKYYEGVLQSDETEILLFSLRELEGELSLSDYLTKNNTAISRLVEKYIAHSDAFIFIIPEYNGSFPGILKLFLDGVPPSVWLNKSACITGISSGRAGNLRGIEHLTGVLNYLKMHVFYDKLPISLVDKIFIGTLPESNDTISAISKQLDGFLRFN